MELTSKIMEIAPKNGAALIIELKGAGLIRFDLNELAFTDKVVLKHCIAEMLKSVMLSDHIDEIMIGPKNLNIYNIRRTLPNRQFRVHFLNDGEIMSTAISTRYYPTGMLHDYEKLEQVFYACILSVGSDSLNLSKLDKPQRKSIARKQKTQAELAVLAKAREERERAAKEIKAQAKANAIEAARAQRMALFAEN